RVYLPAEWLAEVGIPEDEVALPQHRAALATLAARLVDLAEPYYRSASQGLRDLPLRSAWSIATAHGVYRQIGVEVKARGAAAWDARVSTSKGQKLQFLLGGGVLALASRRMQVRPRPDDLWRRPR
ncbi:MAG TPA: phytoene synthase, partial [Pseudomonas sp.]|nr:phytoene synthase [Pseudomonas sp.]